MTSCPRCNESLVYPNMATGGKTLNNCPKCGYGRIEDIRISRRNDPRRF